MNTPQSRRAVLQAAGATALAAGLTQLTATAAGAQEPAGGRARLVTYPVPAGAPVKTDSFAVKVRTARGSWQTLGVYRPTLAEINPTTGSKKQFNSSLACFDFSGEVEVEVTYIKGGVKPVRVRPDSYGIEPEVRGDTLRFTLDRPRKVVIQVNDDLFDCLHLFAREIERRRPKEHDPDVLYFGPGVHTTADGYLDVPSGKTVYVHGGAVLKATVRFKDVRDAGLAGRGVLAGTTAGGVLVEGSSGISVGGVTMLNPNGYAVQVGQSSDVSIKDMAAFSSKGWGDGIDVFSSTDVTIDGVFMRNSDDCIAIYAHRWEYYGDTKNITVRDSTLWADVAHPVNVGTHGNTDNPEVVENLVFENLDICDHREPQMGYQGCIALNAGDSNLIRNVRVDSVRVEDFRWGQLIHMRVMYNRKYNTSVGRGIENVYVKDVSYSGKPLATCMVLGYDADHPVKDVTFENLVVNGTVIADSMKKPSWYLTTDFVPMHANEHVTNLRFLTTAEAEAATAS
ncbi:glycosyl hydrolase family 28 protein [Streptomyces violaceusniger]|uniref:Endo-polygalacturonase n=1 Tax=Streptomyces violaceusniger (strain Tu 4113) TaxID=653045 RepID=G2P3N2_STRV4|nr:glycosyl hydrolase family 28 protein [Streptomyces violaceusniger]AEM84367.1 endo-polygalacturonase [Streptomyces violaceusniger Tu 4113]